MANHPNIKTPGPKAADVRAVRERIGLTQTEAGALIGWSLRGWQQIELGERKLTAQQWALWQHVAGVQAMAFTPRK